MSTQAKFAKVQDRLNTIVLERDTEIRNMLACTVSGQHAFMLGLPGIGKSYLITEYLKCFDTVKYFDKLMTAHTDVSEVFGPVSIKALRDDDKLEYNTEGFLADVHVAFLDEIWKSNSQVLNALLTIMQERKFANGNQNIQAPLISLFGASNELPQDESLGALYDRFICRMHVQPLKADSSFAAMLTASKVDDLDDGDKLSIKDLEDAGKQAANVDITDIIEPLTLLRTMLKVPEFGLHDKVYVSDRRWKACVKFLQAIAWMQGVDKLDKDHVRYLTDCLWDNPDDREAIAQLLTHSEFVSATVDRFQTLYNESVALIAIANKMDDKKELGKLFVQLKERKDELESKIKNNPDKAHHLKDIMAEFKAGFRQISRRYRSM